MPEVHFRFPLVFPIFVKIYCMKKTICILAGLIFLACGCKRHNDSFPLTDLEKAQVLANRAGDLWFEKYPVFSYDSVPDISPVLTIIDSAIAYAPGEIRFYNQKAGYLEASMQNDDLKKVLHKILSLKPDDLDAIYHLGMCLDRLGNADSARYYYRKAINISRRTNLPNDEHAYLDTIYAARLEYFITGNREAAIRKIKESADTAKMSADNKKLFIRLLENFDVENALLFPYGRATEKQSPKKSGS